MYSYGQDFANTIIKDVKYLKDFHLEDYIEDQDYQHWIFYLYTHASDYKIICAVRRRKVDDVWGLKIETFWMEFDRKKTIGAGMEYDVHIKDCNGYEDFVKKANDKLHNNPTMSAEMYHDDYDFTMTKEVVKELIRLYMEFQKIESLKNSEAYEDLKKLFEDTINLSVEETINYIQDEYPGDGDKQMLIYKLNSLDSLDNYIEIQKLNLTPENETFS